MNKKKNSLNKFTQIWIMVLGCSAIFLISRPEEWNKYGFVCGILSQPAWMYTTFKNKQYGIFVLTFFYSCSYLQGIYYNFIIGG